MTDELNGLDNKINVRGFFERILQEREKLEAERERRFQERFDALAKALELQAAEYARRLHDLNGEYRRDKERQAEFVSLEKYEDKMKAESTARTAALLRVDEKFDEYVKRYEQRQREVDLLLTAQASAVQTAERIADEQATKSIRASEDAARKANRNIAIVGVSLAFIVALVNFIPTVVS